MKRSFEKKQRTIEIFSRFKSAAGFTLIETLFSILIFSAALVALITIAGRGIGAANDSVKETTAYYLAQEGLETVRNIRDTNFLQGHQWDAGFPTCGSTASNLPCEITYGPIASGTVPSLTPCRGQIYPYCPEVYFDPVSGAFLDDLNAPNIPGSIPSGYTRNIALTQTTATDEYEVTATVVWNQGTIPHTVTLNTILKKWR